MSKAVKTDAMSNDPRKKTRHATEEDHAKYMDEEEERRAEMDFLREVKSLSKAQIIGLLKEAREEAAQFSQWLLAGKWTHDQVKKKLHHIEEKRAAKIKLQTESRNKIALQKVSESSESKALGVSDYYKLLREAIVEFDRLVLEKKQPKGTQSKAIQAIVVKMLCDSRSSIHSFSVDEWERLVKKNVDSRRIGVARTQLKRLSNKAT